MKSTSSEVLQLLFQMVLGGGIKRPQTTSKRDTGVSVLFNTHYIVHWPLTLTEIFMHFFFFDILLILYSKCETNRSRSVDFLITVSTSLFSEEVREKLFGLVCAYLRYCWLF